MQAKAKYRLFFALSLLWLAFMLSQSALPATVSHQESIGILSGLRSLFPWLSHTLLRKLGHVTEYALFGLLLGLCLHYRGRFSLLRGLAFSLAAALLDETLQLFIPGRSGEIRDLWIDLGGAAVSLLLLFLLCRRKAAPKA